MPVIYEGATEEIRQVVHHHAVLRRGLERRSGALCEAVHSGVPFEEWIATLFAGHVAKVNDLLLPALTGSGADLAGLLAEMRKPPPPGPASARQKEA
jgi:hypothetical protein